MVPEIDPQDDSQDRDEFGQHIFAEDSHSRDEEAEDDDPHEIEVEEMGVPLVQVEGGDVDGQDFADCIAGEGSEGELVGLVAEIAADQKFGDE